MSHYWHGHWTEDAFKPTRLGNWEVPNWHPKWPVRHCTSTEFQADSNGRILDGFKKYRSKVSFKGTWELPTKISRKLASELSAPDERKVKYWELHKAKHSRACHKQVKEQDGDQKSLSKSDRTSESENQEDQEIEPERVQMTFLMKHSQPAKSIRRKSENGIIVTKFV